MTTNKPEVVAWGIFFGKTLQEFGYTQEAAEAIAKTEYSDVKVTVEPLIRLSDYEALQAECEALKQQVEERRGITPELQPMVPEGSGLPRYGIRWNGPEIAISVPMADGYWTPWHLAKAEQQIQRAAQRLPEGWRIAVEAEKGAGWVSLYTPDGVLVEINADGSPAEHIEQAISAAIAREAERQCSLT